MELGTETASGGGRLHRCDLAGGVPRKVAHAAQIPTERRRMNFFDTILVSINQVLGQIAHSGSSTSSKAALDWGLF